MSSRSVESDRSYAYSMLSHVTPRTERCRNFEQDPLAKIFIGPTISKGRSPAISFASMVPLLVYTSSFNELSKMISRYMGSARRLVIVGRTLTTDYNDRYIPLFNNCRFIHREVGGYHVLCRIYPDDVSGCEARVRLDKCSEALEKGGSWEQPLGATSQNLKDIKSDELFDFEEEDKRKPAKGHRRSRN
ncbi:hypothetical protein GCK72_025448 [Caenorhabditis remanei]|uniref:Uncharacterized protein n=1 Tax=Caenorhabditis remanei TaxID=31234 RepID=A0A6A5G2M1_CAERE|nr:hypothetical protein GCK72_025448 [Caenorhabditis remanei]KAF1748981.1 hypothetical protein GCK72_025448 [Caenorhabditis remanei]